MERRFACTQCGKCCNRAPELELGEAAALADVDPAMLAARADAVTRAEADQPWKAAIVRAMKAGQYPDLPTPREVEANAARGAMTTSMQVGWQIAVQAGLMAEGAHRTAIAAQVAKIDAMSASSGLATDTRQTLLQMHQEYTALPG